MTTQIPSRFEQEKMCFKCGMSLPLSSFYAHPMMADGHLNKCKECTKRDVKEHRANNLDKVRAYDRKRGQLEHRKEANKARDKRLKETHPAWYSCSKRATAKRMAEANPLARPATTAVNNALRDGVLEKQPCVVCGGVVDVEGHHEDYSKPLDVIWFCVQHHAEHHRHKRELGRMWAKCMDN